MKKYFTYAIGEILLVVIGILIALQINNWNENRISQIKSKVYYERIVEDLDFMILSLSKEIKRSENVRKYIAASTHILKKGEITVKKKDTLDFALDAYYQFNGVDASLNSIEELKSSGQFNLIKDKELREALTDYTSFLASLNGIFKTIINDINNNQIIEQYIFNDVARLYKDNKISYDFNKLKLDNAFINKLSRIGLHWQARVEFSRALLDKSESLKAEIVNNIQMND